MDSKEYIQNALVTESQDFETIADRMTDKLTIRGLHAALGLVTEAAEFADVFKKYLFYGKPIDWVNLGEESGDLFWYLAIMHDVMGKDNFDSTLATNIAKLKSRYGDKFTDSAAINRDTISERKILENE